MAEVVSRKKRSWIMSRIRGKDTEAVLAHRSRLLIDLFGGERSRRTAVATRGKLVVDHIIPHKPMTPAEKRELPASFCAKPERQKLQACPIKAP